MKMPNALCSTLAGALTAACLCLPPTLLLATPTPRETQSVNLHDPILDMTAYTLTIPSGWNFSSAVIQGRIVPPALFQSFVWSAPMGFRA
jgi:hypothetical protein